MKNFRLSIIAMASVALAACTVSNKPADRGENNMSDTVGLQGEWRLDSYRIDCESTQFDATSNYKLSFNEPDNTFSLSTDCNMINGEFGISNDTIRFKNMLVTEMACDKMVVEHNMLRLLNDSTAYAICRGDTLTFTAPNIGSARFIKQDAAARRNFIGKYIDSTDGSTLQVGDSTNSGLSVNINLFRLTDIDDGIGKASDGTLVFTATDAAGNPIKGKITLEGDTATLVFTESTWEYLPGGSTYRFKRDTQAMIQELGR
ncbi:MAG: META domain-containing protein [Clostridium sp.]|nr:META domain-containing protein [Clostridium sp.]